MNEITEKEKLEKAIQVINALSEGIDYYTGEILDDNNILNNPKYIRLFKYIEDVLKYKVNLNKSASSKKVDFSITKEQIDQIQIPNETLSISKVCAYINEYVNLNDMKGLTGQGLNQALSKMGVIESTKVADKIYWFVTDEYKEDYGIVTREYENAKGIKFVSLNYEPKAQKFILDNLLELIKLME